MKTSKKLILYSHIQYGIKQSEVDPHIYKYGIIAFTV